MKVKSMIKNVMRGSQRTAFGAVCLLASACALTSCDDFFEHESEYVIYDGDNALNNASDTIYSVIGIINKMQAIADRTILLGEVRGDLVDVTDKTSADLREVAQFRADADNKYNNPRDYYAVINNCNYFIANADTTLKNNRDEHIFMKEYAAVKGFRAWTYLQLALNYGSVPFVTEPILTKEQADKQYPRKDIKGICEYFINDLASLVDVKVPNYGEIRSNDSRLFYFPIRVLLGDMNLWAGNYKEAARNYYEYIAKRNGTNSTYPVGTDYVRWMDNEWNGWVSSGWSSNFGSENYGTQSELITMIPGDSIPSEGYYSELRNIYNSTDENDWEVSLVPSTSLINLSAAQKNCVIVGEVGKRDTVYAPSNLEDYQAGDLRLMMAWQLLDNVTLVGDGANKKVDYQQVSKFVTRNVHIYRRTMVYLRLAEALNRAGYPRFAYQILATGVNNQVIEDKVIPYYRNDSTFLRQFDFPNARYQLYTLETSQVYNPNTNTMGIHSHGSGWSDANMYYQLPEDTTITDSIARRDDLMLKVEDMIVDEGALEFAFEGTRFYDLMRVAMRPDRGPSYLADRVYARRGQANTGSVKAEVGDLTDMTNWFLDWNGQIGVK